MSDPKIYVIIVTYNGIRWVDQCFGSLQGSGVPLHTVVVDNGSTDGTAERIARDYPEVHLIRSQENLGFGRGNNLGIQYALAQGADYFFLFNQDAWIFPDTIGRLLDASSQECAIISPVHLDGTGLRMDEGFKKYVFGGKSARQDDGKLLEAFNHPLDVPFVNAAAWLLPRRALETVGGFNPLFRHYGEDNDYCNRVLYHSMVIRVAPGATICHDRQDARRPARNAWVGRYLLITYSDPRFSVFRATCRTFTVQFKTMLRVPYYLLKGDTGSAKEILSAYGALIRRWRELLCNKKINKVPGPSWL